MHVLEWLCRSGCPEHAWEGAERGLESGQRAAWAAANHWASTTVARGLGWRGSRGWLDSCALVGTGVRWVASGFGIDEWFGMGGECLAGGVLVLSWAAGRRWLGVGGGWSEREGESVILAKIASGSPLLLCPSA
jgi:hypothetical protein